MARKSRSGWEVTAGSLPKTHGIDIWAGTTAGRRGLKHSANFSVSTNAQKQANAGLHAEELLQANCRICFETNSFDYDQGR